jgi:uncharacterized protein
MSREILAKATREALSLPQVEQVDFVWHGGETTLLSTSFFRNALALQAEFKNHRIVTNSIQTNATLLNREWVDLFKENDFSVGVSLDLPPERHQRNRKSKNGKDSWHASVAGLKLLDENGVSYGVLIVADSELMSYGAERFLSCLDEHDLRRVAMLNVLPDNASPVVGAPNYLDWERFVDFLIEVYLLRERHYKGRLLIRELDSLAGNVNGNRPTTCIFAGNCMGQFLTVEPSGHVSACDKYLNEGSYVFGDLSSESLQSILSGDKLAKVQRTHSDYQTDLEKCKYYHICNGGCPHDQHLYRKIGRDIIRCCGLARLIDVIRERQL